MIKEKHLCNKTYGNHQLARYIDVYEVSANRCHSVPESGYKGTEVTLVDEPAWNEKFSSYSITGATLTGNNFILNNDVTAQANYETAKNLTLQTDGHGSIAANKMSGFIGDQVTLSNTANSGYAFTGYSITGANLTGNKFNFIGNNVTAKAMYNMTGIIYKTDNNQYIIQHQGDSTGNININVPITSTNYAVIKYNTYDTYNAAANMPVYLNCKIDPPRSFTPNEYRSGITHDSVSCTASNSALGSNPGGNDYSPPTTAVGRIIIDRSAKSVSSFINNNLQAVTNNFNFTYYTGTYLAKSAIGSVNDITAINRIYWYEYISTHILSGLSVAGFTSYSDAYNY